jgi:hypothetical protein
MKAFLSSNKVMTPSVLVQQKEDVWIHGCCQMDYVKSEFRPETTIAFPDYRFLDLDECMVSKNSTTTTDADPPPGGEGRRLGVGKTLVW